jgi:hypothetical protein
MNKKKNMKTFFDSLFNGDVSKNTVIVGDDAIRKAKDKKIIFFVGAVVVVLTLVSLIFFVKSESRKKVIKQTASVEINFTKSTLEEEQNKFIKTREEELAEISGKQKLTEEILKKQAQEISNTALELEKEKNKKKPKKIYRPKKKKEEALGIY